MKHPNDPIRIAVRRLRTVTVRRHRIHILADIRRENGVPGSWAWSCECETFHDGYRSMAEAEADAEWHIDDMLRYPCVARWPECSEGDYDPRYCRFPKSCSCEMFPGDEAARRPPPDDPGTE